MYRIKRLIRDHKQCWHLRKEARIKWRIGCGFKNRPIYSFFLLPTITYNTYPYRVPGEFVFDIHFLHWYIGIGEWCNKENENA